MAVVFQEDDRLQTGRERIHQRLRGAARKDGDPDPSDASKTSGRESSGLAGVVFRLPADEKAMFTGEAYENLNPQAGGWA